MLNKNNNKTITSIKMKSKKGMVFTIDAVLSAIAAAIIIFASLYFLEQTSSSTYATHNLDKAATDSLTVLEKTGTLRAAVETGSNLNLQAFIDSMPNQVCSSVYIFDTSQILISQAERPGCPSQKEIISERRVFIAGTQADKTNLTIYYAQMLVWVNSTVPGEKI